MAEKKLVFPRDTIVPNQAGNYGCFIACAWAIREYYMKEKNTDKQDTLKQEYKAKYPKKDLPPQEWGGEAAKRKRETGSMRNVLEMVGHLGLVIDLNGQDPSNMFLHAIKQFIDQETPLVLCSDVHCVVLYGYEIGDQSDSKTWNAYLADPGESSQVKKATPKKIMEWGKHLYVTTAATTYTVR
jgi:hypothetical protein